MTDETKSNLPDPKTTINLEPSRVICSRHGEPFQSRWPKGYLIFSVKGMHKLLMRDDFANDWGNIQKLNTTLTDQEAIGQALDGFPMCCRLGSKDLIELYEESDVGVLKVCSNCSQTALGAPYRITQSNGKIKTISHICFNCVVNRMVRWD